jgi:hypothetical protein
MSHEWKVALEKIVTLCAKSRIPTNRIERIYDIALEGLGMTANQREFEIRKMREAAIQARRDEIANRNLGGRAA